jgi:N-acetylglucosamine-6-sulfatase
MRRPRRRVAATVAATAMLTTGLTTELVGSAVGTSTGGALPETAAVAAPEPTGARAGRPNLVVVMADDMRVDDLRFAPTVRNLVGRVGVTFENSFSPYPLCCPARASFLTGTYAHNHGVLWHKRPYGYAAFDDSRTLATSLATAGYRTGFVGKYLNGYGRMRSLVSGQPSVRYVPHGWDDWRASIDSVRGVRGSTYNYFDLPLNVNGRVDSSHRGEYSSTVIGDESVAMARRFAARPATPFFMDVSYVAPHSGTREPGDPPSFSTDRRGNLWDFRTPGRPTSVRGRFDEVVERGAGMPRDGGPSEQDISDKPASYRRVPEPSHQERGWLRDLTRQRAEAVSVMDEQVGRLVAELKRSGAWRRTVLAFTSDNGYFLGEHRRRSGKVRALEPSLRVPLLVTGPGLRSGERRYDPITTIDLSATLLDLGDAEAPWPADGVSRVPTLRLGDQGWTSPVLTEAGTPGNLPPVPGFDDARTAIGIRTARYSYIVNRRGSDELYDLLTDPLENQNVILDKDYSEVRLLLEEVWAEVRNCAGDQCQAALPEALQSVPVQEREWTRRYWAEVQRVYGW